jgi:hypothetical protein
LRTEFGRASLTFYRFLDLLSKLNNTHSFSQYLFFLFVRFLNLQTILILRAGFGRASLTLYRFLSLFSRLNDTYSLFQYLFSFYDQIRKLFLTIRSDFYFILIFDFEASLDFSLFFEFLKFSLKFLTY